MNRYSKSKKDYIEKKSTNHAKMMSLGDLNKTSKSICKILTSQGDGTGFFVQFPKIKRIYMITCFHVITQNLVDSKEEITIQIQNENKETIILDKSKRYIKCLIPPIDISILEILDSDSIIINNIGFLLCDLNFKDVDGYNTYMNKDIYILGHPQNCNDIQCTMGKVKDIDDFEFEHSLDTDYGSSGSPIILHGNLRVIGVHKARNNTNENNIGTFVGILFKEIDFLNEMNKMSTFEIE